MSTDRKVLRLSEVRDPVAGLIEVAGEQYEVRKYTGLQYQQASLLSADSPVTELFDLVRQVVPALPEDLRLALDRDQCLAVLALASQGIAVVEQLFPNAFSPEPPTSPG